MILNKPAMLLRQRRKVIFGIALCISLWLMSGVVLVLPHQSPALAAGANLQAGGTVNVVVSSTGCSLSSATQSAGQITLRVANQTGQPELTVQLYGGRGELIREVSIAQGTTEWSETFELAAGNYTLIAGRRQDWVCRITVQ